MGDAPRWMNLLSAWLNLFAGLTLIVGFSVYFIALQIGFCDPRLTGADACEPSDANHGIIFNGRDRGHAYYMVAKWSMFTEGLLWCLAGALLCYRNICNNNAHGAVSQCIISIGGFFFTCSAFGSPANIISLRYLIPITYWDDSGPVGERGSSGQTYVSFSDACPYYGITMFMIATTMGIYSVKGLPKDKIVSPFWGVFCFFMGAWTIGVITLYAPMLWGGETRYEDLNSPPCIDGAGTFDAAKGCVLDMPTFAWYPLKIVSVIGACFLMAGATIFAIMDNFLGLPTKNDEQLLAAETAGDHGVEARSYA